MTRICICTSNEAAGEPRAPRHAVAIAEIDRNLEVVFIDSAPIGVEPRSLKELEGQSNITWQRHQYPSRSTSLVRLVLHRLLHHFCRICFRITGKPLAAAVSARIIGLKRKLSAVKCDIYIAHNIDTLLPAREAAARRKALLIFDSMEFHSDMGDGQDATERSLVRRIESAVLPDCSLVVASSDQIADALVEAYGISRPLPLYNVPPRVAELPAKISTGLALYWRNAVVGFGQRGLEEALVALKELPEDVILHLQGRMPRDGGQALRKRIAESHLEKRVIFHKPYRPEDAVREAAPHHIGLCLERPGVRNHELTVSNKLFDYHMAGLAIIASDLPPLRSVLTRSGGGLLFAPGSSIDLAAKIGLLYGNRQLLRRYACSAREFALSIGNREVEMAKFTTAFRDVCAQYMP
jgi:glycogen(starch) synthase